MDIKDIVVYLIAIYGALLSTYSAICSYDNRGAGTAKRSQANIKYFWNMWILLRLSKL